MHGALHLISTLLKNMRANSAFSSEVYLTGLHCLKINGLTPSLAKAELKTAMSMLP